MKILQLCVRIPFPPNDGGTIAMHSIAMGLLDNGNEVTVFSLNTKKHAMTSAEIKKHVPSAIDFIYSDIDTSVTVTGSFLNLFSSNSYNVSRFYSEKTAQKLIHVLTSKDFDVVIFETLFMSPYLDIVRKYSKAKVVLRAHNLEHLIWERLSQSSSGIKKWYLGFLSARLKSYEIQTINKFDAVLPITSYDADLFRGLGLTKPCHVVVVGVNTSAYAVKDFTENCIFHFGSMNWLPNEEAVSWFLNKVWNTLHKKFPTLKWYIAGRNMPEHFRSLKMKNIEVIENVESPADFISTKSIMIVPLLSGSGMRVKIVEGMAYGKAIVSTRIGAEGIEVTDGKNIFIADRPDEFVSVISNLINQKDEVLRAGREARKLAETKYDNKVISKQMQHFFETLLIR